MKKTHLILAFLLIGSTFLNAQDTERKFGFTASIQSEQIDFLIPIWVSNKVTISPSISFIAAQDVGSDLSLGLVPKVYLSDPVNAVPYLTGRVATVIGIPKEGDNIYDFILGLGVGGEYFFQSQFSIGIELQGNLTISDEGSFRFGNPGNVNFNTATALTASIYF